MSYNYFSPDGNAKKDTRNTDTRIIDVTVMDTEENNHTAKVTFEAKKNHGFIPSYDVEVMEVILPEGVKIENADEDIRTAIELEVGRIEEYVK